MTEAGFCKVYTFFSKTVLIFVLIFFHLEKKKCILDVQLKLNLICY